MKNMKEFYASLHHGHPVLVARSEHAKLLQVFEEEPTDGSEIPDLFAAATKLRSELEELIDAPSVVAAFIGMLDAEVTMMRSVIHGLKGSQ